MRYLAVTTCNAEQWTQFGRAMANTYCRHWPKEVPLCLYAEGFVPEATELTSAFLFLDLEEEAPWLTGFKTTYGGNPRYQGGSDRRDYRRDAVRFSHKIAALGAAAEDADCNVLIWIDADVITHARVTEPWLDSLFPPQVQLAWLDRWGSYPECGFMMFRMPDARNLITRVVNLYQSGNVFHLMEHHDSFVFQHVANIMANQGKLKIHSLSGAGRSHTGHPFANSPLSCKLDHLKGESRKALGRTPKEQRHIKDDVEYWR